MSKQTNIMDIETVALDDEKSALVIIDQTKLPAEVEVIELTTQQSVWDAIYQLKVRGAPAIGVAAAFGIYLAAKQIKADTFKEFYAAFTQAKDFLDSSRPTAVNLSWALKRMEQVVLNNKEESQATILQLLLAEATEIRDEDVRVCRKLGEYGLSLLKPNMGLLTHCNAGKLATVKYGTATAPMYIGHEQGYNFKVFCDETRPLLQGARLTAFELQSSGIDTTLICDNMASTIMKNGWVDAVFVGCDRVALNGDAANKIGTSYVALAAKHFNIPFYVVAPTSTIDPNAATGDEIEIEQRPAEEITEMWYKQRMAPKGVGVYNPAFDVTPADHITAIITEFGVVRAPYEQSIEKIIQKKQQISK